MTIPARLHFCWIGTSLSWAYAFAILSAAERSELAEIVLHHTDALEDSPAVRSLGGSPRVRLARVDPVACLTRAGAALGLGDALLTLYRKLDRPVLRADVLRAAILWLEGGIYLDLDTITTASLLPLLDARAFVSSEFIVWPRRVRQSRSPLVWARHLSLDLARKAMRQMPHGWKAFRHLEKNYFRGMANGAMGAEPNSPLLSDYLHAMLAVPPERQAQMYALGPDLLQDVVERYRPDELTIHEPRVFYPLSAEISAHWFRFYPSVDLHAVLLPDTRVAHWYASVRVRSHVAQITPDYVRQHRERQLYSALVCSCIGQLP